MKGSILNELKYNDMLKRYYRKRGWDEREIPKKSTLKKLGLSDEAIELEQWVQLSEQKQGCQ